MNQSRESSVLSEEVESENENEELEELEAEEEEEPDPRDLLTKEQIKDFKVLFDEIAQNDQKISVKYIGYILRVLGHNPTKAQIKKSIKECDPFKTGRIDFQSFLLPIAQRIDRPQETHEQIIEAFRILDEENEGFLTTQVANEYLTTYGEDLEDFEIELFLKMAETKNTGNIYYVEFVEKMFGIVRRKSKVEKKKPKKKGAKKKK